MMIQVMTFFVTVLCNICNPQTPQENHPEEGILFPTLCNLIINDIPEISKTDSEFFADDNRISRTGELFCTTFVVGICEGFDNKRIFQKISNCLVDTN